MASVIVTATHEPRPSMLAETGVGRGTPAMRPPNGSRHEQIGAMPRLGR
jgi:hypothetical protein